MRNERTGKKAASIAGRILKALRNDDYGVIGDDVLMCTGTHPAGIVCTVGQLKILAASALTQSPDKPKKAAKK